MKKHLAPIFAAALLAAASLLFASCGGGAGSTDDPAASVSADAGSGQSAGAGQTDPAAVTNAPETETAFTGEAAFELWKEANHQWSGWTYTPIESGFVEKEPSFNDTSTGDALGFPCYRVTVEGVTSLETLKTHLAQYFTAEFTAEIAEGGPFFEKDGALYFRQTGIGGSMIGTDSFRLVSAEGDTATVETEGTDPMTQQASSSRSVITRVVGKWLFADRNTFNYDLESVGYDKVELKQ